MEFRGGELPNLTLYGDESSRVHGPKDGETCSSLPQGTHFIAVEFSAENGLVGPQRGLNRANVKVCTLGEEEFLLLGGQEKTC